MQSSSLPCKGKIYINNYRKSGDAFCSTMKAFQREHDKIKRKRQPQSGGLLTFSLHLLKNIMLEFIHFKSYTKQ